MKRALIVFMLGAFVLILIPVFNAPRKPPLRTWELGILTKGSGHVAIPLRTPVRDSRPSYWSYEIGLVLPAGKDFDLRGRVVVTSTDKRKTTTLEFDPESVTRSSWLRDPQRISYLLRDDFGLRDGKDYELKIHFDEPSMSDVPIVLHFLSHTDPKKNKSEQVAAEQPATTPRVGD
jgi:hypothetical protein